MSYLDDQNQKQQDPNQQGSLGQFGSQATGGSFAGGTTAAGGSPQNQGTGGTQAFTNIQEYLKANPNSGGGSYLQSTAGGDVANAQNDFNQQKSQYEATNAANPFYSNYSRAQDAQKYLATQPKPSSDSMGMPAQYGAALDTISKANSTPYSAESYFNYTPQTVNSAESLKSGNPLDYYGTNVQNFSPGQYALQQQLDLNDPGVANTRQNVLDQYAGYQKGVSDYAAQNQSSVDATNAQQGADKANLQSWFQQYSPQYKPQQQENSAKMKIPGIRF